MAIVGLGGLLAGAGLGFILGTTVRASQAGDSFLLRYFERDFDLTRDQLHQIRRVLAVRDREMMTVYREHSDRIPDEITGRVETIKRRADERIQAVLDSAQLAQYRKARAEDSTSRGRR